MKELNLKQYIMAKFTTSAPLNVRLNLKLTRKNTLKGKRWNTNMESIPTNMATEDMDVVTDLFLS